MPSRGFVLQPMIPPKRFDIFPPGWGMLRRSSIDAFRFFFKKHVTKAWINRVRLPVLHVVSWTGKINISLSAFAPENLVSRDGFCSPVSGQPAHLYTQAESCAYLRDSSLRDSSRVPRRRPFIYFKPPYTIGSVPSLSSHAIAYRWRSLLRVRRHRASKPQGSSERVLPRQVTMDQLIYTPLFPTPIIGMKWSC